jgi:N-glycosylase/DNA lyase
MNCSTETLKKAVHYVAHQANTLYDEVDWREHDERSLWYGLVSCILGSRVRFEDAEAATGRLRAAGVLDALLVEDRRRELEASVAGTLSGARPGAQDHGAAGGCYPFSRIRARYICCTAASIYEQKGSLRFVLEASRDARDARTRLVDTCLGIGPKQASLFLRNVGYSPDLAILDSHVLRFMTRVGLVEGQVQSIEGMARYEYVEGVLQRYARRQGVTVGVLDLAIWVVMRVSQKEFSL